MVADRGSAAGLAATTSNGRTACRLGGEKEDAMTFDELLVDDRIATVERLNMALLKFGEEARADAAGGVRRAIASALVRLGGWLDRGAVERVAMVTRRAH
jgi:hypothetical protein